MRSTAARDAHRSPQRSVHLPEFDRPALAELAFAEKREWLVTNGLGGFASGTVAGLATRRYHGLLFAAVRPPVGRMLLCPAIDVEVAYDGERYALATHRWKSGAIAPQGWAYLTGFRVEGSVPVWTYACADAEIEQRVWMEHDANLTYAMLRLARGRLPAELTLRVFGNCRDLHGTTHAGDWRMGVGVAADGELEVVPYEGAPKVWFRCDRAALTPEHVWYRDFAYACERERGLDDTEDHLLVGSCTAAIAPGDTIVVAVADHPIGPVDAAAALSRRGARNAALLQARRTNRRGAGEAPPWLEPLVLAADQFVVRRPLADDPGALTVIAGYPWFGDWGRDTTIALPGLALATGRPGVARKILTTCSRFVDGGMLPNVFPDDGEPAQYNTVDAALWYVEAVRRYVQSVRDRGAPAALFPSLRAIVAAYTEGTRFGIRVDPADGLLRAGEPGVQVTWMDAKVGDRVITPRIGKPVEVNALWIAALRTCGQLAAELGEDGAPYRAAAEHAEASFEKFWNEKAGCCFDVLDGPDGADASVRPNQIFAVALPIDVLDAARRRAIVDLCAARLWTPAGLRSLDPRDPHYRGHYGGPPEERDGAYHQGTVWTWLAGPFALAQARVDGDTRRADVTLARTAEAITALAVGSLPELADGDPPFVACGAIAQAWSVATILDAWDLLHRKNDVQGERSR